MSRYSNESIIKLWCVHAAAYQVSPQINLLCSAAK